MQDAIMTLMFKALRDKYKARIKRKLEEAVGAYFQAHPEVKLIVVTGSVGKTSTKTAIATVLSQRYRVRLHEGNHNTDMSVPLAILGVPYPENVRSFGEWRRALKRAKERILQPTDVDVIVQELGADQPGDIEAFGRYLRPYMAVITGVTQEHMEYFKTIEAVAKEELMAGNFSQLAVINRDDIDGRFADFLTNTNLTTYGTTAAAEYRFEQQNFDQEKGRTGTLVGPEITTPMPLTVQALGEHNVRPIVAAATVGIKFGLTVADITNAVAKIRPVPGRMQLLRGLHNSKIIDDSYKSSPEDAIAAIQTFFSIDASQRIAIMGSMNELGDVSKQEHERIGQLFNPDVVDWVITVGDEAAKYLAPAAHAKGCQVKSFANAVQAGAFAHSVMQPSALVLVKGSQNQVYTEEAIKILLLDQTDVNKLVRQSAAWMATKEAFFERNLV